RAAAEQGERIPGCRRYDRRGNDDVPRSRTADAQHPGGDVVQFALREADLAGGIGAEVDWEAGSRVGQGGDGRAAVDPRIDLEVGGGEHDVAVLAGDAGRDRDAGAAVGDSNDAASGIVDHAAAVNRQRLRRRGRLRDADVAGSAVAGLQGCRQRVERDAGGGRYGQLCAGLNTLAARGVDAPG